MKKSLIILASTLLTSAAFAETAVFNCKESGATAPTVLAVGPSQANLGGTELSRDTSYIPGNLGKKYDRFTAGGVDLLVPTLMTRNRTNQGNIVAYANGAKIILACIK